MNNPLKMACRLYLCPSIISNFLFDKVRVKHTHTQRKKGVSYEMLTMSTKLLASITLSQYILIENYKQQLSQNECTNYLHLEVRSVMSIEQYYGWAFIYIILGLSPFQAFMAQNMIGADR